MSSSPDTHDQHITRSWRTNAWQGCAAGFKDPAPWYFRTLESWLRMLRRCGFGLHELCEPTIPGASAPLSVLFTCQALGESQ
jgi:hypothetical protein